MAGEEKGSEFAKLQVTGGANWWLATVQEGKLNVKSSSSAFGAVADLKGE